LSDLRVAVTESIEAGEGVRVSAVEAERVLRAVGIGPFPAWQRKLAIVGSPLHGIGPVRAQISIDALHEAIEPVADQIAACIGHFVSNLPEELEAEAREGGICLTGGGALLPGMVERLVGE